jgi:hypothetical protein
VVLPCLASAPTIAPHFLHSVARLVGGIPDLAIELVNEVFLLRKLRERRDELVEL